MKKAITFSQGEFGSYDLHEFGDGRGPKVAITATIHGEEQTSTYVAERLLKTVENIKIHGSLTVIPVCNPDAFRSRSRCATSDGLDLNRSFCQKEDGSSYTIKLANSLWEQTKDCEYLLDLHSCGIYGSTYVMSQFPEFEHQKEFAQVLGIRNVNTSSGAPGQLFVETNRDGRKANLIEIKGGQPHGVVDLDAGEEAFSSAVRFLNWTGIVSIDESSLRKPQIPVFHGKISRFTADSDELFVPAIDYVPYEADSGTLIGMLGSKEIRTESEGTVLAVVQSQFLFNGERIYTIAPEVKI